MTSPLIPPSPVGQSLHSWAMQMTAYVKANVGDTRPNDPAPVLLPHQMAKRPQSAVTGGALMFDPVAGVPVYAWENDWWRILSQAPDGSVTILGGSLDVDGQVSANRYYASSPSPSFNLHESDTNTEARIVVSGGDLYIQSGEEGQGGNTSSGNVFVTGFNNANVENFYARKAGGWRPVALMDYVNDGYIHMIGGAGSSHTVRAYSLDSTSSTFGLTVTDPNSLIMLQCRGDGYVRMSTTYDKTSASAANIQIDSAGWLRRSTSLEEYKDNFRDIEDIYSKLDILKPIKFYSIADERDFYGFGARNVGEAMPEAFYDDNYDVRSIAALNTAVLKDMDTRLRKLENGQS